MAPESSLSPPPPGKSPMKFHQVLTPSPQKGLSLSVVSVPVHYQIKGLSLSPGYRMSHAALPLLLDCPKKPQVKQESKVRLLSMKAMGLIKDLDSVTESIPPPKFLPPTLPANTTSSFHAPESSSSKPSAPATFSPDKRPARSALDIISEGMGLEGKGQTEVKSILKQQQEQKEWRERQKGAKKVRFQPFTRQHQEEVRKMMDKLRRRLAQYARKHSLNLTQIGDSLQSFLDIEKSTEWQSFLTLRGSARRKCEFLC